MFPDLDLVFFDGRLKGNVSVNWVSHHDVDVGFGRNGITIPYARFGSNPEGGQCEIKLNASKILRASEAKLFELIWMVLVHEMWFVQCHAPTYRVWN